MTQYIRNPIDINLYDLTNVSQVSQIVYHNEHVIIINYDNATNSILVEDNEEWFCISSPDIPALTIKDILIGLGYGDQQIVVTWSDDPNVDVLNIPVQLTQLNQIALYDPNQSNPLPNNIGPFPEIVRQSIVNENIENVYLVDTQNDDDDDTIICSLSESIDNED